MGDKKKEKGKSTMSSDLIWSCIKNNTSLIRRNGAEFSREKFNLTNRHCMRSSGLANKRAISVSAGATGVLLCHKSAKHARKPNKVVKTIALKKDVRRAVRAVKGLTRNGYRADLEKDALARTTALFRFKRSQKIGVKPAPKRERRKAQKSA